MINKLPPQFGVGEGWAKSLFCDPVRVNVVLKYWLNMLLETLSNLGLPFKARPRLTEFKN